MFVHLVVLCLSVLILIAYLAWRIGAETRSVTGAEARRDPNSKRHSSPSLLKAEKVSGRKMYNHSKRRNKQKRLRRIRTVINTC